MGSSETGEPRGSGILRHAARDRQWQPPADSDADTAEAIDRHIEEHFGSIAFVWHEIISDLVHIDVNVIEPTPSRPYYTLVTSGMSDLPMTVPDGVDSSRFAELMICLPADWPLTGEASNDERAHWPIRLLKMVARLPHEYGTWIAEWHSMPNGDPAEPYAPDTPFTGVMVAPLLECHEDARVIITEHGKRISLLALVPLHPAEMELKVSQGTDALLDALRDITVSEVFDAARPSSV
jgi:Suppressor of fused protein (SUFU)